jgi:endoglucanase
MEGDPVDIELLTALCEAPGAPGREERIRNLVIREMEPYVDEISVDPMGSVAGVRKGGGGPRVVLAAHMDELGFLVTHIDDKGFIRVVPLGGFDPKTKVAQRVIVHGREDLLGVMGAKPIHIMTEDERKRLPKPDDHYIDVGLPAERVRELVQKGDPVTRERTLARLGDLITCKSLDNRAGLYVMLQALRRLGDHHCEVIAVATTQEEVGLRGARVAAQRLRPDIGLAIDITLANDGPGAKPHEQVTAVGGGAAIKAYDSGVIVPRAVIDHLVRIAGERGIPTQIEIMSRGGTDTRELQLGGDGALAGCVSIPTRYVHQVVETCHPDDLEASVALVAAFCDTAQDLL